MAEQAKIIISAEDRSSPAFQIAKRNVQGVLSELRTLPGVVSGATAAIGAMAAAVGAVRFKGLIDGIDALNDIKDVTGSSIENISALEDIAKRAGHGLETVESALVKITKELTAAKVDGDFAQNLRNIGLDVEKLKQQDPAKTLHDIAKALAEVEEGPEQAQLVFALLGKTTKEIGPFLKDLAEKGQLNATILTKQAEETDKFNKNLAQLRKNSEDSGRAIVNELVPRINDLVGALKGAEQGFDLTGIASKGLNTLFETTVVLGANTAFVLKGIGREIGAIAAQGAALARGDFKGFSAISDAVKEDGERARKELDEFEQRVLFGRALKATTTGDESPKPKAPKVADTAGAAKAASEAYAKLRAELEANIKGIGRRFDETQDVIRFGERMSQQLYTSGLQSLERYHADQDKARQDNLAALRQATNEEIAQRQRALAAADKPEEREKIRAEIAEAQAKLRAGEREAEQSARLAVGERARAVEQLRDQVNALGAEIKDLSSGNTVNADLLQIAERVRAAGRLMTQAGASPEEANARAAELGRLLEVQRQMAKSREDYTKITADAALAEEKLMLAAREGGVGLLETERQLRELRAGSLRQLEALIAKERERLQQNPWNEQLQRQVAELEITAARARAAVDPTKLRFDAAADNIGASIADGFARAVTEGAKLRDIVKDIGRDIARIVTQELVTRPLATEVSNLVKGAGSSGGGWASLLSGLFPRSGGSSGGSVDFSNFDFNAGQVGTYSGFDGGYTGSGGVREVAGVVHGQEYVFSAAAVARLGRDHLEQMHRAARAGSSRRAPGYFDGGFVGEPAATGSGRQRQAPNVTLNLTQNFGAKTTKETADQAAVAAGRAVSRAVSRGNA